MNPALWGLCTALAWGTADFAARFTGRGLGHVNALLGMLIVGAVAVTAWVGVTGPEMSWEPSGLWLLFATGLGVTVATLLLYQGLVRGPVSIVAPIVSSYPALVLVIALVLGAEPTPVQWIAIAGVMAGVYVVARAARQFEAPGLVSREDLRKTVFIALGSSVGFALAVSAAQAAVPIYGALQTLWVSRLVSLGVLLPIFLLPGQPLRLPPRWWPLLGAQGLLDTGAYLALFAGSKGDGSEIAAVVASGFGVVTVLLARAFLREPMTWRQWGGVVLIFASVAVLSWHG